MNNITKKRKPLTHTKEGEFIQSAYRAWGDTTPPPYFYRGKEVRQLGGGTKINLLCLYTLKWREFDPILYICDLVPKISDELKLGIIPFLQDEPVHSTFLEPDLSVTQLGGLQPSLLIYDEIADTNNYYMIRCMRDFTYGQKTISTPIIKVTGV